MDIKQYFIIIILLSLVIFSIQKPCQFIKSITQDGQIIIGTTDELNEQSITAKLCHSFSHSVNNSEICILSRNRKECEARTETDALPEGSYTTILDDYIPIETRIPNVCGYAGRYEPLDSTVCTKMSLPEGFCCFTLITDKAGNFYRSCQISETILGSDKDKEEINSFIKKVHFPAFVVVELHCNDNFLIFSKGLLILILLF